MSYTVKELAKMSGVSSRTLRWYDQVGLLKPAFIGGNGYRYYEEEQLLLLQQILFFRELGFSLKDIQRVLGGNDFETIRALSVHRRVLEKNLDQTMQLIETIGKTISHIGGKEKMESNAFYDGFDRGKSKGYEKFIAQYRGTVAEDLILESRRFSGDMDEKDAASVGQEGTQIYKAAAECIEKGLDPTSDEVQALVARHYKMMARHYTASKEVYTAYAELYAEHSDFQKALEAHHSKLPEFFAESMRVYAHRNLT